MGTALFAPGSFQPESFADFATLIGISLFLGDIYGDVIRGLTNRLTAFDSMWRIQDFLSRGDNEDSRMFAPDRLVGDSADGARQRGRNSRRRVLSEFIFRFTDASVAFSKDELVLRNMFLLIPRGKVTMVTGSVGCGKSTFLKVLIGQVKLTSGTLLTAATRVAYCSQKPWIRNISIRDNIVGESPLDRVWLTLVLYVCALDVDLARLPNGELTIAGPNGCNLSGGQKHRVVSICVLNAFWYTRNANTVQAFARSLYAKMEVIIVDDLFAVLDKSTSSTIRIRLFGETDILSRNNMTLIMATSQRKSCKHVWKSALNIS